MITATTYRHHHHSKYKFCCSMLASQMEQCTPNCRMNLRWKGKYNRKWNNEFKWAWTCGKPSNLSRAKVHEQLDVGASTSAQCGAPQDDTKIGIISRKMRSNSLPGLIQFPASKRHKHRHQGHNPSANLILRDKMCLCKQVQKWMMNIRRTNLRHIPTHAQERRGCKEAKHHRSHILSGYRIVYAQKLKRQYDVWKFKTS